MEAQGQVEGADSRGHPDVEGRRALLMTVEHSTIDQKFGNDLNFLPPRRGKVKMGVLRTPLRLMGTPISILPREGGGSRRVMSIALVLCLFLQSAAFFASSAAAQDKKLDSFNISFASVSGT